MVGAVAWGAWHRHSGRLQGCLRFSLQVPQTLSISKEAFLVKLLLSPASSLSQSPPGAGDEAGHGRGTAHGGPEPAQRVCVLDHVVFFKVLNVLHAA